MSNSNFKIAVVSDDGIKVSQHFGSAQYYEVFTVENAQITKREKLEKSNSHAAGLKHQHEHQHGATNVDNEKNQGEIGHENCGHGNGGHGNGGQGLHGLNHQSGDKHKAMLANISDCEYLIARGMGFGIYQHLEIAKIKPIITDIRLIEDAVKATIDGTIVSHTEKLH